MSDAPPPSSPAAAPAAPPPAAPVSSTASSEPPTAPVITGTGIPAPVEILLPLPPAPQGRIPIARRATSAELSRARWALRQYRTFSLELADLEGDALYSGYSSALDQQRGGGGLLGHADPTGSRAMRLVDQRTLRELRERVDAVRYTLAAITDDKKQAMLLHYNAGQPWDAIGRRLGVSKKTVEVWHLRVCTQVAERLRRPVPAVTPLD